MQIYLYWALFCHIYNNNIKRDFCNIFDSSSTLFADECMSVAQQKCAHALYYAKLIKLDIVENMFFDRVL